MATTAKWWNVAGLIADHVAARKQRKKTARQRKEAAQSLRRRLLKDLLSIKTRIIDRRMGWGRARLLENWRVDEANEIIPLEQALSQDLLTPAEWAALAEAVVQWKAEMLQAPGTPRHALAQVMNLDQALRKIYGELRAKLADSSIPDWDLHWLSDHARSSAQRRRTA